MSTAVIKIIYLGIRKTFTEDQKAVSSWTHYSHQSTVSAAGFNEGLFEINVSHKTSETELQNRKSPSPRKPNGAPSPQAEGREAPLLHGPADSVWSRHRGGSTGVWPSQAEKQDPASHKHLHRDALTGALISPPSPFSCPSSPINPAWNREGFVEPHVFQEGVSALNKSWFYVNTIPLLSAAPKFLIWSSPVSYCSPRTDFPTVFAARTTIS